MLSSIILLYAERVLTHS